MATAQVTGVVMAETRVRLVVLAQAVSRLFPSSRAAAAVRVALVAQMCSTVAVTQGMGQEVVLQAAMPGGATAPPILPVGVTPRATQEPITQEA